MLRIRKKKSLKKKIKNTDSYHSERSSGLVLAGFWRRMLGGIVDTVVALPFVALGFWMWVKVLWVQLPNSRLSVLDWMLELPFIKDPLLLPGLIFGIFIGLTVLYFVTAFWKASPGQRILGLRLVDGSGSEVGPFRIGVRTILLFLSAGYLLLGVLWIGFDRLKQGWHDKLAGTFVVVSRFSEVNVG